MFTILVLCLRNILKASLWIVKFRGLKNSLLFIIKTPRMCVPTFPRVVELFQYKLKHQPHSTVMLEERSGDHENHLHLSSWSLICVWQCAAIHQTLSRYLTLNLKCQHLGGPKGKVCASPKLVGFILWGLWMSAQNLRHHNQVHN